MTAAQAAKLREAFPHVQRVKKTWKDKTGQVKSVTLDYISHAVVTDRLLSVDPDWSFEPLLDGQGFPIVVTQGLAAGDSVGVWGRLTVLGTTVVEFCSDTNLVNAYSRCLCRCAMRRGVALDLWIKDDGKDLTDSGGIAGDEAGEPGAADRPRGGSTEPEGSPSAASPALKPPTGPRGSKAKPTAEELAALTVLVDELIAAGHLTGEQLAAAAKSDTAWPGLADELSQPVVRDLTVRLTRFRDNLGAAA